MENKTGSHLFNVIKNIFLLINWLSKCKKIRKWSTVVINWSSQLLYLTYKYFLAVLLIPSHIRKSVSHGWYMLCISDSRASPVVTVYTRFSLWTNHGVTEKYLLILKNQPGEHPQHFFNFQLPWELLRAWQESHLSRHSFHFHRQDRTFRVVCPWD